MRDTFSLLYSHANRLENRKRRAEWTQSGAREAAIAYEAADVTEDPDGESDNTRYTMATISYTLKSGRRIVRNYTINMTKNYELIKFS